MTTKYKLYGAPISLYTGKARAYLRYKKIPFDEVFSSRKVYKNIIVPNTGVKFIPVLKTPSGEFIQDTSVIIDTLEQSHPRRSVVPVLPKQKLVSAIFELWGDEWLLLPAMHYRWNHDNFPFIYDEFGKIVFENMPAFIRRYVGKKLGARFKDFVPMLGITPHTIPAIEQWYEQEVLPTLDEHFSKHRYLLGGHPCVGDFGLIGPLYAHLYRDPAPGKLMQKTAPKLAQWVERMNQEEEYYGAFVGDDLIPDTLLPLLKRQFIEFWPVLIDSVKYNQQWIEQHPHKNNLPRMVGKDEFTIGGMRETRSVSSFSQWKLQRVLDIYQQFNPQEKIDVDEFLKSVGGYEYMQTSIKYRVTRSNNRLVVLRN